MLRVKNKLKVSTFEIIQKLRIRDNNQDMENLKNYLKKCCCKEHTLKSEGYFASSINNLSKEAAENCIRNQG